MHRTRGRKTLALTARDIEIFRWLSRYRYLRSTYLHAFAGGASITRFKERLGDLFHEGFIDRPEKQWEFAHARHQPAVYEIGVRARDALAECGARNGEARTFLGPGAHRQFRHALTLCAFLASIELAALADPSIRFIPWSEILDRAPETTRALAAPFCIPALAGTVIPDGIFGLEYRFEARTAYRFFAVEIDQGTMPVRRRDPSQTSLLGKQAAYADVLVNSRGKSHLGVSRLLVLTVVTGERRLATALSQFAGHQQAAQFLFRAVEPSTLLSPNLHLLHGQWLRSGLDPIAIDNRGGGTDSNGKAC